VRRARSRSERIAAKIASDFVDREDDRIVLLVLTEWNAYDEVRAIENMEIEEAQSRDGLLEDAIGDVERVAEMKEVVLDLGMPRRSDARWKKRAKRATSAMYVSVVRSDRLRMRRACSIR
jgi:hypothetical protein